MLRALLCGVRSCFFSLVDQLLGPKTARNGCGRYLGEVFLAAAAASAAAVDDVVGVAGDVTVVDYR